MLSFVLIFTKLTKLRCFKHDDLTDLTLLKIALTSNSVDAVESVNVT